MKMKVDLVLLKNISHRDVARDLWEHIRKRFYVSNGPRNQNMKADLACCKQHGMTMEAYYGILNKIWDNVNNYSPLQKDREHCWTQYRSTEQLGPNGLAHTTTRGAQF
ncbi:hypothetical protein Bca52824_042517 [Brassica carinata]|uniref:Retrotransposon gag domain-containing protein n=1 Tax=Brassica carinata TaxID=52824 RepID=A0A8X7RYI0_BRACI|nr:hypothetical protein Bca52824_042517 [Brassica carinata]